MTSPQQRYLTEEGYKKIEAELKERRDIIRKEIAERIATAKELGDLSENAEYQEAKDAQAFNEGRIAELESLFKSSVVVNKGKSGIVNLGSKIKVRFNGRELAFTIVSFNEADPGQGRISNESPLGKALIGKLVGDEVKVEVPSGKVLYKILEVN